jgi:hypothetical protein
LGGGKQGQNKKALSILVGKLKRRDNIGDTDVAGKMINMWFFKKTDTRLRD